MSRCDLDVAEYLMTSPGRYDPWMDLANRPGVDIVWREPGPLHHWTDPWGLTSFNPLRIWLRKELTATEMLSTLTHELLHLDRGPFDRADGGEAREEAEINLLVAQRLVDPTLAEWLAKRPGGPSVRQVGRVLGVDWRTFERYMAWRVGVTRAVAEAAWESQGLHRRGHPVWPAPWMDVAA